MPTDPNEHPSDTRPFLCIPYWTSPLTPGGPWDTGESRALPGAVVSYACESIHTSTYKPGTPLDVTVDVRNSGGGSITPLAIVTVYWADPTVGFAKPQFFAACVVDVPVTRTSPGLFPTATMTAVIPASAPDHICLVVSVSHAQDLAGTVCDPINDRHWAQHNLQAVSAGVGVSTMLTFAVANPFPRTMAFDLRVGPVDERRAHRVAALFKTLPSGVRPHLRLLDQHGTVLAEGESLQTSISMDSLGQEQFQLAIQLNSELAATQSAPIEAELLQTDQNLRLVGSLGWVIL